jgi:hypothetical protein
MIITRILQGLGNQFFQYAFGRAMAIRNRSQLKLDTSFYENAEVTQHGYTVKRNFELARYNVQLTEASADEIAVFKGKQIPSLWKRTEFKLFPAHRTQVIEEDLSTFSPELNNLKGNLYLGGYFSSEEFFKDHAAIIRKEFTLKNSMSAANKEWAEKMKHCNSVCISLRLNDFLHYPLHNVCSLEYYYNGLKEVERLSGGDITVFIWSDDNVWTAENFKPPYPCHYMSHNFPDFHEDLRLMTHCKHHVIPNSTFSWWAAWLGEHETQIVVAPERWLNSTEIEYRHVVPERWHKIKN